MRIVTVTEQLLYDILQEQKRTNELLEQLVPKQEVPVEEPVTEEQTPQPAEEPKKRRRG